MKRAVILAAVFAAAFAGLTVYRHFASAASVDGGAAAPGGKESVRAFWDIMNQATAQRSSGHFAEAATLYRRALAANPSHEDSLYYLGICALEQGRYAEAEQCFRRLVAANPSSQRGYMQLGNVLSTPAPGARLDFQDAAAQFEKAIEVNREQAGPFLQLGSLELNRGQWMEAERRFDTAVRFGAPEAKFLAGYSRLLAGQRAGARELFHAVASSLLADRKVIAQGVLSEGDLLPSDDRPMTALERAGVKSMLFEYWAGGNPLGNAGTQVRGLGTLVQPAATGGGRAAWSRAVGKSAQLAVAGAAGVALYRYESGRLSDVTAHSGVHSAAAAWDVRWADVNGDGQSDLYVLRSGALGTGQNELFLNNGDGTFHDATTSEGLGGRRSTMDACFLDADGDGRADLIEIGAAADNRGGVRYYRNMGGRFTELGSAGFDAAATAVDCAVADVDGDGKDDVFVQYWRHPARLYRNRGAGAFEDATPSSGLSGIGGRGFSAAFLDYDRDGRPDLLVTTQAAAEDSARSILQPGARSRRSTSRLFRNTGGRFVDVTAEMRLDRAEGAMQAIAADIDGDGWTDIVLVNGSIDALRLEPSVVLRNNAGKVFELWGYLPSQQHPANFLGGAVLATPGRAPLIYLSPNSLLRAQSAGGLYTIGQKSEPRP